MATVDQPNVLLLVVDDLKPVLGAYGNDEIPTPNIDRLAAQGTVMQNNYCQQAICAASRMSMFTGLRPDSTKVWDLNTFIEDSNPKAKTMQQVFKESGYTTAGAGKVMHGSKNHSKQSWSTPFTYNRELPYNPDHPIPAHDSAYYQNENTHKVYDQMNASGLKGWGARNKYMQQHDAMPATECLDLPDDAYLDGALANWANANLEEYARTGESFFLTVGFSKPHLPFAAPKKYWDMFDRQDIELAEFQEHAKGSPGFAYHPFAELRAYTDIPSEWSQPISDVQQAELIHGYYACVAYIDAQIGKILDTLHETGLDKNTIVVLWGDHGFHLGDHGLWTKHTNFENATEAPLIISAPGFSGGKNAKSMTESVDIFPTLIDLTGLEAPYELEGVSLVPVMKDEDASVKDYSISQFPGWKNRMGYALRDPQYRMIIWMKNDWRTSMPYSDSFVETIELYDYEADPLESVNLANDPDYKEVRAMLEQEMIEYFAQHEAS